MSSPELKPFPTEPYSAQSASVSERSTYSEKSAAPPENQDAEKTESSRSDDTVPDGGLSAWLVSLGHGVPSSVHLDGSTVCSLIHIGKYLDEY